MRIAIFNTYDISPGENGGEIRSQNIYRRLSHDDEVRFISYDLRCKVPLQLGRLAPSLRTVTAEVSYADRYAFFTATERMGLFAHDVLCVSGYDFSPAFLAAVRSALIWAQVVVVLQPYLAPFVFDRCHAGHLKIYEAHNVEIRAKSAFLSLSRDAELARHFTTETLASEAAALTRADLVIAVSDTDAGGFTETYGVRREKIRVVPNGVSVAAFDRIRPEMKAAFRAKAGLADVDTAVFLGSAYGPNVDSYRLARQWLDAAGFDGAVLIIGRIADVDRAGWPPVRFAEHWLGFIDEDSKQLMMSSADFALQIVVSGGGTNLKLFDYMAAGIPILANQFGARGIAEGGWYLPVETEDDMRDVVSGRTWRAPDAAQTVRYAREIVRRDFDWGRIADLYRRVLA